MGQDGAEFRRLSDAPHPLAPGQLVRWAWAFYLALALAAVVWIGVREGPIRRELFLGETLAAVGIDLSLGVGAGLGLVALWGAVCRRPLARELEARLAAAIGSLGSVEVVALAILSGFAEELFFRGAVQRAWGLVPAALTFALLHTGRGRAFLLWTAFAAIAGFAFGALVALRGTLAPAIVAHALVNAVNLRRLAQPFRDRLPTLNAGDP